MTSSGAAWVRPVETPDGRLWQVIIGWRIDRAYREHTLGPDLLDARAALDCLRRLRVEPSPDGTELRLTLETYPDGGDAPRAG